MNKSFIDINITTNTNISNNGTVAIANNGYVSRYITNLGKDNILFNVNPTLRSIVEFRCSFTTSFFA